MGRIWCLDVGCGDASIIATASATFLVDCHCLGNYARLLPSPRRLRGVFITHQHEDHYSGLEYLAEAGFAIDYLICSPYKRRHGDTSVDADDWTAFQELAGRFRERGTKVLRPYRQVDFSKPWWKTNGASFWMLGPSQSIASSGTRELHDACLVLKVSVGSRSCLFTGDASDKNLQEVARTTKGFGGDILHASHHGSLQGADLGFVKKSNPAYTVISTESGVYENVPHPTALKRYRSATSAEVYRTDESGDLYFEF